MGRVLERCCCWLRSLQRRSHAARHVYQFVLIQPLGVLRWRQARPLVRGLDRCRQPAPGEREAHCVWKGDNGS